MRKKIIQNLIHRGSWVQRGYQDFPFSFIDFNEVEIGGGERVGGEERGNRSFQQHVKKLNYC